MSERPRKDFLFQLQDDLTERNNLALAMPDKVRELKAVLTAHHANMPPPQWPSFIELPIAIDKTSDQKQLPSDEYTYWSN